MFTVLYIHSINKKESAMHTYNVEENNPNFIYAYNRKSFNIFSKIEEKRRFVKNI